VSLGKVASKINADDKSTLRDVALVTPLVVVIVVVVAVVVVVVVAVVVALIDESSPSNPLG